MARTVRDAALFLSAIAGPDPRDPLSIDAPPDDYLAACDTAVDAMRGLRVAWSADFGYAPLDPEVRHGVAAAARRFSDLGCHVEEVNPGWPDPRPWHTLLWEVMQAARHADKLAQHPEWIEPSLAAMIERGQRVSSLDYAQALLARTAFYEQARRFMAPYDLLLTPQMPCVAWPVDQGPSQIGGRPTPEMYDRLPFTFPFNLTGWPAASVPCGFNSEGLPIALQIVAPWHQDTRCLQAAAAFEAVQPWAARRPTATHLTNEPARDTRIAGR